MLALHNSTQQLLCTMPLCSACCLPVFPLQPPTPAVTGQTPSHHRSSIFHSATANPSRASFPVLTPPRTPPPRSHVVKLSPQPQLPFEFGFLNTNSDLRITSRALMLLHMECVAALLSCSCSLLQRWTT